MTKGAEEKMKRVVRSRFGAGLGGKQAAKKGVQNISRLKEKTNTDEVFRRDFEVEYTGFWSLEN